MSDINGQEKQHETVEATAIKEEFIPNGRFAKWKGVIDIGEDELDCYVLDNENVLYPYVVL